MKYLWILVFTAGLMAYDDEALVLLAYQNGLKPVPENLKSLRYQLDTPEGELTSAKIRLGRKLFFDTRLSHDGAISCASCHASQYGGADGRSAAVGHMDRVNPFHLNTPTVFNTAFSKQFFWDGRSLSLQDQAKGPIQAPFEMAMRPEAVVRMVRSDGEYPVLFSEAYGSDTVTFDTIVDAIAAYEKTLVTKGRYDDFLLGDFNALKNEEKAGLRLFITKGCVGCHNGIGLGGQTMRKFPLSYHPVWSMARPADVNRLERDYETARNKSRVFSDETRRLDAVRIAIGEADFHLLETGFFDRIDADVRVHAMASSGCGTCHREGVSDVNDPKTAFPIDNRGGFTGAQNAYKYFRVPLLRNVVRTRPYFHNGSVEQLEDAIRTMGIHQVRTRLTDREVKGIVAFLKAVDGELLALGID